MSSFDFKKQKLIEFVDRLTQKNTFLAYSGGVDSALLLYLLQHLSLKNHTQVTAVYFETQLAPSKDRQQAERFANELGSTLEIIKINEFALKEVTANSKDRCYHCKKHLFSTLTKLAHDRSVETVLDGTNWDDLQCYRPGQQAAHELGIVSPLALCHMTKQDIRLFLSQEKLSVAHRPSSPCLATRIPYGEFLTKEKIEKIQKAEDFLKTFGFFNIRVRLHQRIARIEVDRKDFDLLLQHSEEIINKLKTLGFTYITLDIEGFRSGSMDL